MDEPTAWLRQATADREAAERLIADDSGRCHAIAKWQQTVEKAVKAIVSGLHDAGIIATPIRARHDVERYVRALIRLPRAHGNRSIQNLLHGLLNQETRAGISALDDLVPQIAPRRNTEYPFTYGNGQWTYPAAEGVFSNEEVQQFRDLAYRILGGATTCLSHAASAG